MENPVKG